MDFNLDESAAAALRNRGPILEHLPGLFADVRHVLEVGSGTGIHASYFARHLPNLDWQPSEHPARVDALSSMAPAPNLLAPIALDALGRSWDVGPFDAVFMANLLHMLPEGEIPGVIERIAGIMEDHGLLVIYGPFHVDGVCSSDGNAAFDRKLREQNPLWGLRDVEQARQWGEKARLPLRERIPMPANNMLLTLSKSDR